jgi:hypothetical protein
MAYLAALSTGRCLMSLLLRKATLVGISIATIPGLADNAHATHVGVGKQQTLPDYTALTLLKRFLIDLAVASALVGALILYAIWDQM